jgi:GntR family transcriptional regulator
MLGSARATSKTLTEAAHQELRAAILKGTFGPGSQLPGEMELVTLLGVSRTVVREALRILEEDGLITRRRGIGTFVRKHPILNNLSLDFGTTDMITAAGMVPGTHRVDIRVDTADAEAAAALDLKAGTPVVVIERVRTASGRPVVYSVDVLARNLVKDLDDLRRLARQHESLYAIVQQHLGLVIDYGVARILPVTAPRAIAHDLSIKTGSPLLYLLQVDYGLNDEAILYSREYHLPDAFDFMILRRGPVRLSSAERTAG